MGYGVHTVLVSIRDRDMCPLPGVTVADMGVKMALNGVDNARLIFDNVRVPRTNLLNRSVLRRQTQLCAVRQLVGEPV